MKPEYDWQKEKNEYGRSEKHKPAGSPFNANEQAAWMQLDKDTLWAGIFPVKHASVSEPETRKLHAVDQVFGLSQAPAKNIMSELCRLRSRNFYNFR